MKCTYCKDPIYKFQKRRAILDKMGKKRYYHKGCHELMLDKIIDRVKKSNKTTEASK